VPEPVVTFLIIVLCALAIVPPLAIVASTRSPEARQARAIAAAHAGVRGRLGGVLATFVRAVVFGRAPEGETRRATVHVWTLGTRGPATVLVVFERGDDTAPWAHTGVFLRPWIPFARPQELARED
jgi:hypothetical protein